MKGMPNATQAIQILLVDDHAMFREGLARTLEREHDFSLAGQSGSSAEALSMLPSIGETGVVLLDVDLGSHRALEFVEAAKRQGFQGHILVLTAGVSGQEALQLVQAGVHGILHKHHTTQVLCRAIRKVVAGEACLEQEYLTSLFQSVDRTRASGPPKLTERDRAVLRYILQGLTNKDIGAHINISEGAVKASLRQLFEKLGVRTRAQLVKVALEQYRDQM